MGEFTIRDAAKALGKSVRTVRGWIVSGRIVAQKDATGYRWLIPESEVLRIVMGGHDDGDEG